ncbi:PHA/PHB synthase family protein [Marinibaculum pumilum]|uniref:PHA/PHB synthase family protein n=1 Tax=Marinibaculum pumilum TaxID=1766165 RepID=A0ABV7L029_9PROT
MPDQPVTPAAPVAQPLASRPQAGGLPAPIHHGLSRSAAVQPDDGPEPDSYSATAMPEIVDRSLHAAVARMTAGLSPTAMMAAWQDWAIHLAAAPGKRLQLVEKANRKALRMAGHMARCMTPSLSGGTEGAAARPAPCIEPLPQDRRFSAPAWRDMPFSLYYQSFLLTQQWWHNATTGVPGVTRQHERAVTFAARQLLDIFSPSNYFLTNPEVLARTRDQGGMNLLRGSQNMIEDWERAVAGRRPVGAEAYQPGGNLAVTPGKVVYRNRLIELIQYAPAPGTGPGAETVRPEPVLIVPAWIMKYYILDLSPENSLIRHLVAQGHTVFAISWKNPGPEDRDLSLDDYRRLGVMAALEAIGTILPGRKSQAVGYCLGGTLLTIAAAAMARDGDHRLATVTLFAAQSDFTEAGELQLFLDESQLSFLEDMMWEQGFLDTRQMSGAFQLLRSNDLIWSRVVHDYMMGERAPMSDLMAWNADLTRMPYRMHSEYLRRLFLNNDLAEGRLPAGDRPVAVGDIRVPVFAVGTEWDHVAPWRSAFKIHLLTDTEITFVLTSGGHNAGIVSPPPAPGAEPATARHRRHYRIAVTPADDGYLPPDDWLRDAELRDGSWWPSWFAWLAAHSGSPVAAPAMGAPEAGYPPLCDAPGTYIRQA